MWGDERGKERIKLNIFNLKKHFFFEGGGLAVLITHFPFNRKTSILLSGSFDFILTLFYWDEDRPNLVLLLIL